MSYINQRKYLGAKFNGIYKPILVSYDPDAQAYFNVNTAITSTADKNAINTFYLGLKTDGIYTKIKAMYLPLWLTASNCKWNLVNPLDTDSAFRLTFSTGFTHTSGGTTGNGTSAYANSFFIANSNLSLYNSHLAFYSRTIGNPVTTQVFLGNNSNTGIFNNKAQWWLGYLNTGDARAVQHSTNATSDFANKTGETSRAGFWINNRTTSTATTLKLWKNGTAVANATTQATSQILNTASTYIWARRNTILGNPQAEFFSDAQGSFISIGDGLTDTESTNFSNRVNTLMTYFGINVY
jgi:hypothetical protein